MRRLRYVLLRSKGVRKAVDEQMGRTSDRGFFHMNPIPSAYGGEVKVYESSAASYPHIWLNAWQPSDLNDKNSPKVEATVHLRLEDAEMLRDQLTFLINNHYQETT